MRLPDCAVILSQRRLTLNHQQRVQNITRRRRRRNYSSRDVENAQTK